MRIILSRFHTTPHATGFSLVYSKLIMISVIFVGSPAIVVCCRAFSPNLNLNYYIITYSECIENLRIIFENYLSPFLCNLSHICSYFCSVVLPALLLLSLILYYYPFTLKSSRRAAANLWICMLLRCKVQCFSMLHHYHKEQKLDAMM